MYNNSEKSAIINIQIEKNHIFVCFLRKNNRFFLIGW